MRAALRSAAPTWLACTQHPASANALLSRRLLWRLKVPLGLRGQRGSVLCCCFVFSSAPVWVLTKGPVTPVRVTTYFQGGCAHVPWFQP